MLSQEETGWGEEQAQTGGVTSRPNPGTWRSRRSYPRARVPGWREPKVEERTKDRTHVQSETGSVLLSVGAVTIREWMEGSPCEFQFSSPPQTPEPLNPCSRMPCTILPSAGVGLGVSSSPPFRMIRGASLPRAPLFCFTLRPDPRVASQSRRRGCHEGPRARPCHSPGLRFGRLPAGDSGAALCELAQHEKACSKEADHQSPAHEIITGRKPLRRHRTTTARRATPPLSPAGEPKHRHCRAPRNAIRVKRARNGVGRSRAARPDLPAPT